MIPEDSKITVLSKGIWYGLNGLIPVGGHIMPNSVSGERLAWKKAQKKLKKNKISLRMNRIIPHFMPVFTMIVWCPWNVASRVMSRHHWNMVRAVNNRPVSNRSMLLECINFTSPVVSIKALNDPVSGHGLRSTKWKG